MPWINQKIQERNEGKELPHLSLILYEMSNISLDVQWPLDCD